MVYQRIEQRDGYQLVTSVTDKGTYLQFSLAPDGTAYNIYTDEITRMGWASVAEFLRLRPGFVKVEVVKT